MSGLPGKPGRPRGGLRRPRQPELCGPVSEHAGTSGGGETEMNCSSEPGAIAGSKEPRSGLAASFARRGNRSKDLRQWCATSAEGREAFKCVTTQLMREGPSKPACRSGFQTTFGGCGQKPWS